MGIFATLSRRSLPGRSEVGAGLSEARRPGLPSRFEAVGEALAGGSDPVAACQVAGAALARDGVSLGEALDGLRVTWRDLAAGEPSYAALTALSVAWSEGTLAYLHQLSCTDPMTGLASLPHVRTRLSDLYRERGAGMGAAAALVVCELAPMWSGHASDTISRALRLGALGEAARTVFPGEETIGRLGDDRLVVLAARDERLGRRAALLGRLARAFVDPPAGTATEHREDRGPGTGPARVWIEGLPPGDEGAGRLLDELQRSRH